MPLFCIALAVSFANIEAAKPSGVKILLQNTFLKQFTVEMWIWHIEAIEELIGTEQNTEELVMLTVNVGGSCHLHRDEMVMARCWQSWQNMNTAILSTEKPKKPPNSTFLTADLTNLLLDVVFGS